MTDPETRHGRGLIVVIALAVIFFALLGLIVVRKGRQPQQQEQPAETLSVLSARLRIRTEPQARAAVVATLAAGDRVKLIEDRGAWVRVETSEGLSGWAERANLERTTEQERRAKRYEAIRNLPPLKGIVTDRAQLHSGPGIFYPLIGELAEGATVTVYTRDHDFYAVAHDNTIAYASVDAIDVSSTGTRQLDVRTTDADVPTATAPPVAETMPPEPPVEQTPVPVPEPIETATGVYSVVPAGGTQPRELDRAIPRYPSAARRAGIEGAVVVRGIVRRDGTIDNVEIIRDLPYGLGEEARRAVSRWRFRPATLRGEPIDVYYTVTVNFKLQ